MVVYFLVSCDMRRNCIRGPQRNVEAISDNKLPVVYIVTNGIGFPSTKRMKNPNEKNVMTSEDRESTRQDERSH